MSCVGPPAPRARRVLPRSAEAAVLAWVLLGCRAPATVAPAAGDAHATEAADPPRLLAVRAEVALDLDAGTYEVDATVRVATHGASRVELALGVAPGPGPEHVIESVREGGTDLRFTVMPERLVVELPSASPEHELTLVYRGPPDPSSGDVISATEVMLREESGWLPVIYGSHADFEVELVAPAGLEVFGQGVRVGGDGLAAPARWRHTGESFALYGAPQYVTRVVTALRTRVTVAAWPRDAAQLEAIAGHVERALTGLAELGDYPFPDVAVVEGGLADGNGSYGALSNISIGWRSFADGGELRYIAHELAHAWFGGVVSGAPSGTGPWTESFAEYVCTWALAPAEREAVRAEWADAYASLDPAQDLPVTAARWEHGEAYLTIAYAKGPLVLAALEQRIGHAELLRSMHALLAAHANRAATWADFVAVVRHTQGDAHADWLAAELERVKPKRAAVR